ncbi:MAG: hypothetical protein RMJ43_00505 [Chloroherpetonaceae bacterium]|nr:hypothetical protein [Chthonomonadaceae bacterium]MDW8206289.1 hypothetical protein [Chloroherpetonaceae bacterium]
MEPVCLTVHPIYGAVYKDGEYVSKGAILGFSVDTRDVVIAPVSGWIRLIPSPEASSSRSAVYGLRVEIWQNPDALAHTGQVPTI